ncbi:MAG: NAD(P)-dependent oxidoreductase [Verrucomicrobiota bacterium]
MNDKQTVLVTGAGGSIGRAVCRALKQSGWQVRGLSHRSSPGCVTADLRDPDALEKAAPDLDPAAVLHLAAVFPGVPDAEKNPRANEQMLATLRSWMTARGTPAFLLASTCAVYGAAPPSPCVEDCDPNPQGWYAEGKLTAEQMLENGPWRGVALRIAAPYGPNPPVPTVVHHFLARAAAGEDLTIWGSGRRTQQFIYVTDVARAFLLALDSPASGVFNVSGPEPVSMAELAAACVRITRSKSLVRHTGQDPQESFRGLFPWDKARAGFGFEPLVSLEEGLTLTARHMGFL